jgi:hypothetical protein
MRQNRRDKCRGGGGVRHGSFCISLCVIALDALTTHRLREFSTKSKTT